jgi:hypothetical protein
MKLTTSKKGFRFFTAVLLILGASFIGANQASAQVLDDIQMNASLGLNWKDNASAQTVLENAIEQLVQAIPLFPPGSAQLQDAQNHLQFYKGILSEVQEGESVRVSTIKSLGRMNDGKNSFADMIPRPTLLTLYSNGVTLLTN